MSKNRTANSAPQVGAESASQIQSVTAKDVAPVAEKKVTSSVAKIAFFGPLIESGQHTAKELLTAALASGNFPKLTESTIRTFLTDSKNAKYNKFDRLVVKGEGGKLSFAAKAE